MLPMSAQAPLEQMPAELRALDTDLRKRWSVALAFMLVAASDDAQRAAIIAAGEGEWVKRARETYKSQGLTDVDFRRAFYYLQHPDVLAKTVMGKDRFAALREAALRARAFRFRND